MIIYETKKWQFGISLSGIAIGKQEEASVEGWFLGISCFPQHKGQRDILTFAVFQD